MKQFLSTLQESRAANKKTLAVLIDPDKFCDEKSISSLTKLIQQCKVDFVFVGGSLLVENNFHQCVKLVRSLCEVPLVLFPGSPAQISEDADALLFLSLISGRNADLLIGQHVAAAPKLAKSKLEIVPTGYMLVDCGRPTTASYISQTLPLPYNKPEIAAATALAGEMLGLKCFYLDGGSGADKPVSPKMIREVSRAIHAPLIVGGGITNEDDAKDAYDAGADLIVVGTAFEKDPELLFSIAQSRIS